MQALRDKLCYICMQHKPISDFGRDASTKDCLRACCKQCHRIKIKKYAKDHPEKRRILGNRWYKNNKEKAAQYYKKNKERINKYAKQYASQNKEAACERTKRWSAANADHIKKYRTKNKEAFCAYSAKHRARKVFAGGSFTDNEVKQLMSRQQMKCSVCRTSIIRRFDRDHIIPLSAGGSNFISNIQLLCPSCNRSKGAKDPVSFMQRRGFLL